MRCDVLPLADDVRVLVIDAGFSTLPPSCAVAPVPEVEWDCVREMVDETNATVILVCGALGSVDQGHDVTLSVLLVINQKKVTKHINGK
jgi:hypothetical protein